MKKLACLLLVICLSFTVSFAKGSKRKYNATLDNTQVTKAQKDQRKDTKTFASGKRYTATTRGTGLHLFGKKSGATAPSGTGSGQ